MSKKLDYLKIISELTSEQYAVYSIIVGRAKYFITRLYNEITKESISSREEFSRKFFTEYMLQTIDGYTTRIEAQLLNWLIKFPKFFEWYKGNWSYESLISSVLFYWKKKPNSLKLTKLFMVYSGYIRFINSKSGEYFLIISSTAILNKSLVDACFKVSVYFLGLSEPFVSPYTVTSTISSLLTSTFLTSISLILSLGGIRKVITTKTTKIIAKIIVKLSFFKIFFILSPC